MQRDHHYAPISPFQTGLRGVCPRCGQGKMFNGLISLTPKCRSCGLDYSFADAGDGPAVFVILLAGIIILGATLYIYFTFNPPIWLLALMCGSFAIVVCLALLRLMKGVLVALQYTNKASEGRLED